MFEPSFHNVLIGELQEVCSIDDVSREEQNVVYYVCVSIHRSIILKRNHWGECKNILVADEHAKIDIDTSDLETSDLSDSNRRTLFDLANSGALSSPSEYCFHMCLITFLYFSQIFNSEPLTKTFLSCLEHEKTFVEAVAFKIASSNSSFHIADPVCSCGHNFRRQIFVKLYHCFIKNFLKRINDTRVPKPRSNDRKIRKLTSMSAE